MITTMTHRFVQYLKRCLRLRTSLLVLVVVSNFALGLALSVSVDLQLPYYGRIRETTRLVELKCRTDNGLIANWDYEPCMTYSYHWLEPIIRLGVSIIILSIVAAVIYTIAKPFYKHRKEETDESMLTTLFTSIYLFIAILAIVTTTALIVISEEGRPPFMPSAPVPDLQNLPFDGWPTT